MYESAIYVYALCKLLIAIYISPFIRTRLEQKERRSRYLKKYSIYFCTFQIKYVLLFQWIPVTNVHPMPIVQDLQNPYHVLVKVDLLVTD